jgi:hypothetical protein
VGVADRGRGPFLLDRGGFMAPIDSPEDVSTERWVARRVVEMHQRVVREDGRRGCAQCEPDGSCRQLTWASTVAGDNGERFVPPAYRTPAQPAPEVLRPPAPPAADRG